jgi:hypothetical protein
MDYIGEIRGILASRETPSFRPWDALCFLLGEETDVERFDVEILPYLESYYTKMAPHAERLWCEAIADSPLQRLITHLDQPHPDTIKPRFDLYDPIYLKHMVVSEYYFDPNLSQLSPHFFDNKDLRYLMWNSSLPVPRSVSAEVMHLTQRQSIVQHADYDRAIFREIIIDPDYLRTKPHLWVFLETPFHGLHYDEDVWVDFVNRTNVLMSHEIRIWNSILPEQDITKYPIICVKAEIRGVEDFRAKMWDRGVRLEYVCPRKRNVYGNDVQIWDKDHFWEWYEGHKGLIASFRP